MAGQPSDPDPVETIAAWIIDSRTTLTSREQRARLIEAGHDPRNIDLAEQRIQAIAATATPSPPAAPPPQPMARRVGTSWSRLALMAVAVVGLIFIYNGLTSNRSGGGGGADTTRCSPASSALLEAISQGLTVSGGGTLGPGYVVKSNDFAKVWMVAAEINGPAMEGVGDVGVWATNDPSGGGLIFAVDGMAKEFSDWADGGTTDARLSLSDDGVSAAKACAGG